MNVPELDYHSADNLVNPTKFFPAEIHVPHRQLRNFISTAYESQVFFVDQFDIFVIDLEHHQRSLLATVPFGARCLAANHGWVCVGGETNGDCAFVRIGEGDAQVGQYGHDLIVDMLGKEIVNSMTIHRMPSRSNNQQGETVALISNNDKTVTLYSLSRQEVLCVLPHPVPMNYASMSPDCTMIAAVGDSNEAYFYRRQEIDVASEKAKSLASYQEYNWRPFAIPQIPAGEGVSDDFSFAVAFSPSGHLCAVSAKGGAISVFDMHRLSSIRNNSDAEQSILCTFRSSRTSLLGCVRSLAFSPEPWDLLAWTEDHGAIGIADVRRSFVRRQCVSLDRDAAENIEVEDITLDEYANMNVKERLKHQYMHRMRALRGHPPVGARLLDDTRSLGTTYTAAMQESLDLDARERSVLDALETTIDDVEHYSLRPYSVNYTSSQNIIRPSTSHDEHRQDYDIQLLNPNERTAGVPAPRRRSSVVLSDSTRPGTHLALPGMDRSLMTASPAPMSENNLTPPMSTNDLTPSSNSTSQPLPYNIPPSDPWHVIEAQLIADRMRDRNRIDSLPVTLTTAISEHPASLAHIEAAIYAERQLSSRLERQLADERRLSTLLGTELEARERLLEARQLELEMERSREGLLSPGLEHVLQRQLQNEQENGLLRSNEIENEIISNGQRVERLMSEREALLLRAIDARGEVGSSAVTANPTQNNDRVRDNEQLEMVLRQMEEERRVRRQRVQDLELQIRRAESRVEIASAQAGLESARERIHRVSDARFLAASRPARTSEALRRAQQMDQYAVPFGSRATASTSNTYSSRLRAAAAVRRSDVGVNDTRSTLPRTSELAGRVSENDMRLARSMLHAAVMDANGNWIAGHPTRRISGQPARSPATSSTAARASAIEDRLRESGVGTAGIGWSLDGSYLYTGSEIGIFEFKVNVRDRMQFPSLEMR